MSPCHYDVTMSLWCHHVTIMSLCYYDVTMSLWCHHVTMMSPCHYYVTMSLWCHHVTMMLPCHYDVTMSLLCHYVTMMSPCHYDVTMSLWCHHVTMMTDDVLLSTTGVFLPWKLVITGGQKWLCHTLSAIKWVQKISVMLMQLCEACVQNVKFTSFLFIYLYLFT